MKFAQLTPKDGRTWWINPEAVAAIHFGGSGSCTVRLMDGTSLQLDTSAVSVIRKLRQATETPENEPE